MQYLPVYADTSVSVMIHYNIVSYINIYQKKHPSCSALIVQLLKDLGPYIQQGLQWVQQKKAEEIQNEENLEAQIYNYMCGAFCCCHCE